MEPEQMKDEQLTPETVEQFNKICKDATELMLSYKEQSEVLKEEISSMVSVYNKNADPSEAIPAEQIMQITKTYEKQMKDVNGQYQKLEEELKAQEAQRNNIVEEIQLCFAKLEKMEKLVSQKKKKEKELQEQS